MTLIFKNCGKLYKEILKKTIPGKLKDLLACYPGEADESDWHYVVLLDNDNYVYLTGGCDYTGWGCRDWGAWSGPFPSLESLFLDLVRNLGLDEEEWEEITLQEREEILSELSQQVYRNAPYGLKTVETSKWKE